MKNRDYVIASEIGDYVFCKRAWWLKFMDLVSVNESMIQGSLGHEKLNQDYRRFLNYRKPVLLAIILSLLLITLILIYLYLIK